MVQFGIWMFDEKSGIIGRPENFPELYLKIDQIWDIKETTQGKVWKWPIEFAPNQWFSPKVADDFNKAFFYAHNFFKGFRPPESAEDINLDMRTIQLQTEILSDYFPGPEGGQDVWA